MHSARRLKQIYHFNIIRNSPIREIWAHNINLTSSLVIEVQDSEVISHVYVY